MKGLIARRGSTPLASAEVNTNPGGGAMSDDIVPEWKRLGRELDALVKGAWTEIMRLDDLLAKLEKRVRTLEGSYKPKLDFHPKSDKMKFPDDE